jgi:hypothetical protein
MEVKSLPMFFWFIFGHFFSLFFFLVKIGLVYLIFELKNTQFFKYHQKKMNKENTGLFPLGRANTHTHRHTHTHTHIYIYILAPALYMNSQGFKLLAHMVTAHLTHAHANPVTELEVI